MPILEHAKHELYAQGRAAGMTRREALSVAGYSIESGTNPDRHGMELDRTIVIQKRIKELQEQAVERTMMTIERLTLMLLEDRDKARDAGQMSAAIAADEKLAKLHGYMVEKKEIRAGLLEGTDPAKLAEMKAAIELIGTGGVAPPPRQVH